MIISPTPRTTINILHATNNAYKCVDLAYMFSQTEEDCNLWVQKLFWERDEDDPFEAPNFSPRTRNLMLIRDDLAGIDPESNEGIDVPYLPFILSNFGGYTIGGESTPVFLNETELNNLWYRKASPILTCFPPWSEEFVRPSVEVLNAFWKWGMTRSYFPLHTCRMIPTVKKGGSGYDYLEVTGARDDMNDFNIITSRVIRLSFGDKRQIHAMLLYRPRDGFFNDWHETEKGTFYIGYSPYQCPGKLEQREVQLLNVSEFSGDYNLLFSYTGNAEPPEEVTEKRWDVPSQNCGVPVYDGGVPVIVSLESPVSEREVFLRWTGHLTYIQLLDSPIIPIKEWTMPEFPDMTYMWQFEADRLIAEDPSLLLDPDAKPGKQDFEFIGDFSTGIRFVHPCKPLEEYRRLPISGEDWRDPWQPFIEEHPYMGIDYYSARCEWFGIGEDETKKGQGDIWLLEDFGRHKILDNTVLIYDVDRFNPSINDWVEGEGINKRYLSLRDVGDNKYYEANKALLKWYYDPYTNTWKSNFGRPSTEDQLRFLIDLGEPQLVRGCLHPMSVPATWNKPVFWTNTYVNTFQFYPGLFEDYIVPGRVLIEGKPDLNPLTPWELLDEYSLQYFAADAHVYFSYPRRARIIRITIQDWYGTTLMDDVRNDWFYYGSKEWWGGARVDHWGEYSNVYANRTVRLGSDYTVGRCIDELVTTRLVNGITPDFLGARIEWAKWKARTIPSLWKQIYWPPMIFFGNNGEP